MSRAARLLELLIILQTQPRFTVHELADRFGVSRRTMLRDLHHLSEMGVPLAATPGPGGGYGLLPSRRLLPLSLTVDEAIGVLLSYEAFEQFPETPFAAQSLSALTKLRAALPPDVLREIDRIHGYVAISDINSARRYDAPLLPELLRAALERAHLRIVYDSRSGIAERLIFPFGLFAAEGYWYCACYDYRRQENLSLRADRFVSIEPVDGRLPPHDLTLRDWLAVRERDPEQPVRLLVRVSARGMKSFDVAALFGSELSQGGESGLIDVTIPRGEIGYFAARLLPLGPEITVESPPEMIAAMRRKAQAILAHYGAEA